MAKGENTPAGRIIGRETNQSDRGENNVQRERNERHSYRSSQRGKGKAKNPRERKKFEGSSVVMRNLRELAPHKSTMQGSQHKRDDEATRRT